MIPEALLNRFVPAQTRKAFTSFLRQECTERMFAPDRQGDGALAGPAAGRLFLLSVAALFLPGIG
jgi:hypothetical protein